ncbi:MAG: hypothetical protein HUU49_04335 [Candidatus Buchananbacteria bacterium]|nr:hypothetical protein [Candidatus Buchananbacteria bacterium]
MKIEKPHFFVEVVILGLLFVMFLAYDLYVIFIQGVNPNEHIPGMLTIPLGLFTYALWRGGNWWVRATPEERRAVCGVVHEESCLNPKHTSRADEGRIE